MHDLTCSFNWLSYAQYTGVQSIQCIPEFWCSASGLGTVFSNEIVCLNIVLQAYTVSCVLSLLFCRLTLFPVFCLYCSAGLHCFLCSVSIVLQAYTVSCVLSLLFCRLTLFPVFCLYCSAGLHCFLCSVSIVLQAYTVSCVLSLLFCRLTLFPVFSLFDSCAKVMLFRLESLLYWVGKILSGF